MQLGAQLLIRALAHKTSAASSMMYIARAAVLWSDAKCLLRGALLVVGAMHGLLYNLWAQ